MPTSPAGQQDAAAFCAAAYPQLVGSLSLYVGDRFLAEELAQEALLRACRQWPTVSALDSPGGWTWRVAQPGQQPLPASAGGTTGATSPRGDR